MKSNTLIAHRATDQSASRDLNLAALAATNAARETREANTPYGVLRARSFDGLPFMVIPSDDEGNINQTSLL